jgi:hypothetical protein
MRRGIDLRCTDWLGEEKGIFIVGVFRSGRVGRLVYDVSFPMRELLAGLVTFD